jgi:hypothetical protein
MSRTRTLACLLGTALALGAPAALADARTSGDLKSLRGGTALLLLPVHSNVELASLLFKREPDGLEFKIDDIVVGRRLIIAKVPAGSYQLSKAEWENSAYIQFEAHERFVPRFELQAGVINYVGELRFEFERGSMRTALSGNAFDALPTLLARERGAATDLLQRFPFWLASPLTAAAVADAAPDPAWRHADWIAHGVRAQPEAHSALIGDLLVRLGATPIPLGTGWDEVGRTLEKLSKRRAQVVTDEADGDRFIVLDGLWGTQGQLLGVDLMFVDRKLAHAAVRGAVTGQNWSLPEPDAWDDLADFARAR